MPERFVDHMKNIKVPSMVEDINEMTYYYELLGNIPNSGVTLNTNKEIFPDEAEIKKMPTNKRGRPPKKPVIELTRDKDGPVWVLVKETPLYGSLRKFKTRQGIEKKYKIDGLMDIKKKLEDKIPKELLDTKIHYDNIKLSDKLYNKWINKMTKMYEQKFGRKVKEDYEKWKQTRDNKPSNKRLFFKETLNEHFIRPRNIEEHMNFLRLIQKKIDTVYEIGINAGDPAGGYYYAYERYPNKQGRKYIRKEYWDPPSDIFDLNNLNKVFKRYQKPLLPKNNSTLPTNMNSSTLDNILAFGKKLEKTIRDKFDETEYTDYLMLKMWQENSDSTVTNAPMFRPNEKMMEKIKKMKGKNNRPAMNEKIFEGIFDKSKSGEVTNIWREDLKNITESFEDIHKDDVNIGISSKDFSNKLVEQVELFLDNIQYFIEVLHHFKEYIIQEHSSNKHDKLYFISNEISISKEEYNYLNNYINILIGEILPNMKDKMKDAARKEHKKAVERINEYNETHPNKKQQMSVDVITDIDGMNELNKDFEPTGPRIRNNRNSSNLINARRTRARTPPRDNGNDNEVKEDEETYEEARQRRIEQNNDVLQRIDDVHNEYIRDRQRRDREERPVMFIRTDSKYRYVIKLTATVVLPFIIRHMTMNTLFRRFNPIIKGADDTDEIVGIYPSTKTFERGILQFCMKTSLTSNICLKYFHPDNFIDTATFKEVMQNSMSSIFKDRIRYLSFSYMNSTGVGGSDPRSKSTLLSLYKTFNETMKTSNTPNIHLLVADEYEEACMELLDTGIFDDLRIKTAEAYKRLNMPRNELIGITFDNGKNIEESIMEYALDAQTYNTLLIMAEETIRMWAYKVYWDWALVAQALITSTMLPWKMNTNTQLISSSLGAITASQAEHIYSFSKSIVLNQNNVNNKVDKGIYSIVDNSTNFIMYGLESGILYFWLNLLNGYMRINIETEDDLVRGKTYLYNNNVVRTFDEIRNIARAQIKLKKNVELLQLKFDSTREGIHIDTNNPKLYVDEYRNNSTPIDIGRINSSRLRNCLYPQGTVVRFRSNNIWRYGIVVDDLGGIWQNNEQIKEEEKLLNTDQQNDDIMSRIKYLYDSMTKKINNMIKGNSRTILFLKRKRNSIDTNDIDLFDVGTSVVNVSHEYMGEQYRSMINLQILTGIFSILFVQTSYNSSSVIANLILQVLAGTIFDQISFVSLLIPAVIIGSNIYSNDLIMMQSSMLGTALIEYSTKSIHEIKDNTINKLGEYFCIIIVLDMEIEFDEATRTHYIKDATFWVPTTATIFNINETYGGSIIYGLTREDVFNFNAKPTIKLNQNEKMIRIQFESDGNKIMIFKRPLFSNTDWSIGNMMEKSSDLIYHPWYYTIFRKHT